MTATIMEGPDIQTLSPAINPLADLLGIADPCGVTYDIQPNEPFLIFTEV
jgi:hypothetical protein